MNDIQIFNNPEFGEIRTVMIEGKEYFFGVDIATALQYKRPRRAITDNCKGVITDATLKNAGNYPEPLVPVGDIYRLIVKASQQSNNKEIKEKADRFERLVFDEILPEIHKTGSYGQPQLPQTTDGKIALLAQGHVELKEEIDSVKADLENFKQDMPLLGVEENKITSAVKVKGVRILGGKSSNAYKDRSITQTVYRDIYGQLYRNFGVSTYKAIKRNQCEKALEIIEKYEPPVILLDRINNVNAQLSMEL